MEKLLSITANFEDSVMVITDLESVQDKVIKYLTDKATSAKVMNVPKTMTLKQIFDGIDYLSGTIRKIILKKVIDELSRLSKNQIAEIQEKFDPEKDYETFINEQNKTIKACIKIELSDPGIKIRKEMGLKLLDWEYPFTWDL